MAAEHLYHLIQEELWKKATEEKTCYFPPTYEQDGFTHATANPDLLLQVANHFYSDMPGKWLCLQMTVESLADSGVKVIFESTAPVGDKPADFDSSTNELFPHIYGGILPTAVQSVHAVIRTDDGAFVSVPGVTTKT